MSRILQLRRGNSAQHENFTGQIGEITIDTDAKNIRVHDGETPGGTPMARRDEIPDLTNVDYVVAWQMPTAENNNTWYRKYKSGWVEMGGIFNTPGKGYQTITLPIELADINFSAHVTRVAGTSTSAIDCWIQSPETSNSTTELVYYIATQSGISWVVYGIAK